MKLTCKLCNCSILYVVHVHVGFRGDSNVKGVDQVSFMFPLGERERERERESQRETYERIWIMIEISN